MPQRLLCYLACMVGYSPTCSADRLADVLVPALLPISAVLSINGRSLALAAQQVVQMLIRYAVSWLRRHSTQP
jgi:hypothetical protein